MRLCRPENHKSCRSKDEHAAAVEGNPEPAFGGLGLDSYYCYHS